MTGLSSALRAGGASRGADAPGDPGPVDGSHGEQDGSRRLLRNIGALAGGQVVTWGMTLVWTLVVPRALGPAGFGLIVSAMSVAGVLGIVLGLGTKTYLVRTMVLDLEASSRLIGTALVLRLALMPVFAAGVALYTVLADFGGDALVMYLVSAATALTLLVEPIQAGFQARERMQYLAYSDVINKTGQSVLGIAVVAVGFRAVGVATSMAVVAAAVIGFNILWIRRFVRIDLRTSWPALKQMVRASFAYWAFTVFGMLYLWIDAIMLSLMTRPEVVGWYGAPVRLFQTLMFLPVMLSTAWLPRLVNAYGKSEAELRRVARRPIELVVVLSAPLAAGTAMAAGIIVPLLYGSEFEHAGPVLVVLGLCLPPMYLNIMLSTVLMAGNRQKVWTWVMVVATVVNPLFNLVAIPATESAYGNGAIGAAISLLLTEIVLVAIAFVIIGREVFDRAAVRRCTVTAAASIAMWAAAFVARPIGEIASVAIGVSLFVVLGLTLGIVTPEERAFLRARAGRFLTRRRVRTDS